MQVGAIFFDQDFEKFIDGHGCHSLDRSCLELRRSFTSKFRPESEPWLLFTLIRIPKKKCDGRPKFTDIKRFREVRDLILLYEAG